MAKLAGDDAFNAAMLEQHHSAAFNCDARKVTSVSEGLPEDEQTIKAVKTTSANARRHQSKVPSPPIPTQLDHKEQASRGPVVMQQDDPATARPYLISDVLSGVAGETQGQASSMPFAIPKEHRDITAGHQFPLLSDVLLGAANKGQGNEPKNFQPYSGIAQMNLVTRMEALESVLVAGVRDLHGLMNKLLVSHDEQGKRLDGKSSSQADHPERVASGSAESTCELSKDPVSKHEGMPEHVLKLPPYTSPVLQHTPLRLEDTPSLADFEIYSVLGGTEFTPGFYHGATKLAAMSQGSVSSASKFETEENDFKECYYLLDTAVNPFVPVKPTAHGAGLVALDRNAKDADRVSYDAVPLFVALPGQPDTQEKRFTYLGHYSHPRWFDRLSYDEQKALVPERVRKHWAEFIMLSSRWPWVDASLDKLIDDGPQYTGPVPSEGEALSMEAKTALKDFASEVREVREFQEAIKDALTVEKVMELFDAADGDMPSGLRFCWDYLECVHYDRNFIYALRTFCDEMNSPETGDDGKDGDGPEQDPIALQAQGKGNGLPFGGSRNGPNKTAAAFSWD